jgi:putative hemolysin
MIVLIQLSLAVMLLVLSAFFAGSETGVYRLSRLQLRIRAEEGKARYKLLFSILQDGQGMILSLLLGNNLVNYLLTSLVTIMLFNRLQNHHAAEIYTTVIITPVIFIFGEIIPKNIFYYKANTLLPALVRLNWFCLRLFTYSGAVPVLKGSLRALSLLFRFDVDTARAIDATQRHQVRQIIHETQEEGLLSESQKDMMSRLMDIPDITVASVMIKLGAVEMVSIQSDYAVLLDCLKQHTHTRQLVYENQQTNIVGFIRIYDVLGKHESLENLRDVTAPLLEIHRSSSVLEAINLLRNHHAKLALVVDGSGQYKKAVGIITITDLIEEMTGELNP